MSFVCSRIFHLASGLSSLSKIAIGVGIGGLIVFIALVALIVHCYRVKKGRVSISYKHTVGDSPAYLRA